MVITADSILPSRAAVAAASPSETGSTERVRALNAQLLSTAPTLCLHRARAYTEVLVGAEGEPPVLGVARAFARTLQDLPAIIAPGELIVGAPACRPRAVGVIPEITGAWLRNEIDALPTRQWDPFDVSPREIEELKDLLRRWEGRTLFDRWARACPPEIAGKLFGTGWANVGMSVFTHGYHFTPPWESLLSSGMSSYEAQTREAMAGIDHANPQHMDRYHFYRALLAVTGAIKGFAGKYSLKALELAGQETDPARKDELHRISEVTARVPVYGARSFHEALQSVYFVTALMHIEGTGPVYTLGRIDQYLYPFFKADVDSGLLTRESAQELIECLFIKLNGTIRLSDNDSARNAPGYKQNLTICLGGVDGRGTDASNELSYLFLEAAESVRTMQPDIILLCHPRETPYTLKRKAAQLTALGLGLPKFCNTETIKTSLMQVGYSAEEANVGWIQGCTEPYGPGCKQYGHSGGTRINLGIALETALFNGRKRMPGQPMSGEVLGVETGDCRRFNSFDDLMQAVKAQLAQQMRDGHIASSWAEWVAARYFPLLLQSLFTDACIERGLPATAGGARINVGPGMIVCGGLATLADSLAAIKKLVFDEKRLSMDELVRAVDADFEGHEALRRLLVNKAPKFGNDDDYVDDIARELFEFINAQAQSYVTPLGNRNMASTCAPMSNIGQGARTWATPDGRKAGTPLSNHIGPTDGMDISGPTAHVNSVTKLDMDRHWGAVHNIYLVNIDSEDKVHNMLHLIDTFHNRGGHHLQINCQDKAVFIDAQKHPERYRGLMVRVAGYVAYFVELPKEVQDQIIGRTDQHV
ncbi:MAG: hypothetical protein HYY01_00045 [Chloroflexi bacterium]|nr:hypothetical protein [Chloroflexota bacterium]